MSCYSGNPRNGEQGIERLVELRDDLRRGNIDVANFALSFEAILCQVPFGGRNLPEELAKLVNKVEIIRFCSLEEDQREEAVAVVNEAVRLLAT